jgi:hypothetical protein
MMRSWQMAYVEFRAFAHIEQERLWPSRIVDPLGQLRGRDPAGPPENHADLRIPPATSRSHAT